MASELVILDRKPDRKNIDRRITKHVFLFFRQNLLHGIRLPLRRWIILLLVRRRVLRTYDELRAVDRDPSCYRKSVVIRQTKIRKSRVFRKENQR